MYPIQQVTDDALQKQSLVLPDGTSISFRIQYKDSQLGWFIQQMTYKTFQINNMRIVTSPNMLHQFRNQVPFGIGCFTKDGQEPTLQQDFSSGRAQLFILTPEEVLLYEEILSGQVSA